MIMMYLRYQWGYLGGPKIVSIPYPCCDPNAAELTSRTLRPVQTLYGESLNRLTTSIINLPNVFDKARIEKQISSGPA